MPASPINNPEPGESLVGIAPPLLQQLNAGWRHRLNFFNGRTLSENALASGRAVAEDALSSGRALSENALVSEQRYRSGLLATLGQAVTPGIVSGLVLSLDVEALDPLVTITPGYGIAASGEDVTLVRALQTRLSTLAVIDATTGLGIIDPKTLQPAHFQTYVANAAGPPAGVFVLQPIAAQVNAQIFGSASGPIAVSGNLNASCDRDPLHYAFEDWQTAEGLRLVFVPWPPGFALAQRNPQATYRNRLVYSVFNAETQLAFDGHLPWQVVGVPVALVAFDARGRLADARGRLAWEAGMAVTTGQVIADPTGKLQQARTALGTTGSAPPAWNETFGQTTADNTVTWLNIGTGVWQATTAFVAGQSIVDPNGYLQTVATAGTSGGAQPAQWNITAGQTTTDGSVVWTNAGLAWRPLFIDRSVVVRAGGLPRRRNVVPIDATAPQAVQPALAQSRIAQLGEQLSAQLIVQPDFNNLASIAATLPPSGVLPAAAMDFVHKKNAWLPAAWHVSAAPVRLEELETALATGMRAATLDTAAAENIEVLIPLPDALYDPNILVTETIAPDFQAELDTATRARDAALATRKAVQLEINALQTVLGPNAPQPNPNLIDPDAGLTSAERSGRDAFPPAWPQPSPDSNFDRTFRTRGPATWQRGTNYGVGQLVIDSNANYQTVRTSGLSGSTSPAWNGTAGQATTDGAVSWLNAGSGTWSANTAYVAGQFLFDPNGNVQVVAKAGTSGPSQYIWNTTADATTADGNVTWHNRGPRSWQANHAYLVGQAVVDANGNIQSVATAGTSGASIPAWGTDIGQVSSDGSVSWLYEGQPTVWARTTAYRPGQFFVDPNANVQQVKELRGDGTSGASPYFWNFAAGGATTDGTVTWSNTGPTSWQPNTTYAAGQFVVDANGNVQTVQVGGRSGGALPTWNVRAGGVTTDGAVTWVVQTWTSLDMLALQTAASAPPYTLRWPVWKASTVYSIGQIVTDANGSLQVVLTAGTSGAAPPAAWGAAAGAITADAGTLTWKILAGTRAEIPLIGTDDWADLASYGLQHFIDRLDAKIRRANDFIDLAFLTTQTDIYRLRQHVLGATDATRVGTSSILAQIATGETASSTAQNLRNYFLTINQKATPPAPFVSATEVTAAPSAVTRVVDASGPAEVARATIGGANVGAAFNRDLAMTRADTAFPTASATSALSRDPAAATRRIPIDGGDGPFPGEIPLPPRLFHQPAPVFRQPLPVFGLPPPGEVVPVSAAPTPSDVQSQSPLVGAQLDIRTISVAERLGQPAPQESLFYATGNRLALVQTLLDLEITVDDIPFLVDAGAPTASSTTTTPEIETHFISELRDAAAGQATFRKMQNPFVPAQGDEAAVFSSGVRVLEQHTQFLRALEGRVHTYADFVGLCTATMANIQSEVAQTQTFLKQLENELVQSRQSLAFTTALLADERQRVAGVNERRTHVLQTSVEIVVYSRPRTLEIEDSVPSRQLVPGNVVNPVPAALEQSSVPPELREMVALLGEVPLYWLPPVASLLRDLDRPILLQQIAVSTQARAALQLRLPLFVSSALLTPSVYGPTIGSIYRTHQQIIRGLQTQRVAFVPQQIANLSWSSQVSALSGITTIADLTSSSAVHPEIASAVALAQQQISHVAAAVYARANLALPADRLAWAEFLRGPGLTTSLQDLSVLPKWNAQSYMDRQQMQLLADWLFAQIDAAQAGAAAYISDVIRLCLLLASHAPVNDVIAGAVARRTLPEIGNFIPLNLPSPRIASGMYVLLYSRGSLAAEAVVHDLDHSSVSARITAVHMRGVYLETDDIAHYTTQRPRTLALRAFSV